MSLEPQLQQNRRYTRIRVREEDDFKRLYPLILDYIREPELALCVKEFVFDSYQLRPMAYKSFLRTADRSGELKAEENARDISQEHSIAQLVTSLGIEEPEKSNWILKYEDGSKIVDDILRRNNYGLLPTTHLAKLRDVTLLPTSEMILGDERFYTNLDILAMLRLFHRLPAIESVSTDAVGPNNDGGYLDQFPPATSNLKKIHVGHSMHGTDVIGPLIRVPKRLEEFTFTTGGRSNLDGGQLEKCPKIIGKALYEHRSSLRKIDIDIDEYIGGYEQSDDESLADEGEERGRKDEWYRRDMEISTGPATTRRIRSTREYGATIGSMHDFESLTYLSIGIGLLLGGCSWGVNAFRLIDALPKSLEYLLIRGYEKGNVARYDDQINEFLLARRDRLPSLNEVHGIDETIPIGMSIENPDEDYDELWQPEVSNDEWTEVLV